MNLELINLNGYGIFVWPAFIFTFACCTILFIKTKRELVKYEKIFYGLFKEPKTIKIKINSKKIAKKNLSASSVF